jgi:hypothetical protein
MNLIDSTYLKREEVSVEVSNTPAGPECAPNEREQWDDTETRGIQQGIIMEYELSQLKYLFLEDNIWTIQ